MTWHEKKNILTGIAPIHSEVRKEKIFIGSAIIRNNFLAINVIIYDFLELSNKTEIAFFGSVLDKPLRDIHDIDLVMTNPEQVYKKLKAISKKYNKPLDIFLPPLNGIVGKIIIYTSGKIEKADVYTSDEFFDEIKDIKEILIVPREK